MGRDIVVGIAPRYELDGPVYSTDEREIFRNCPDRTSGQPASYTMGTGSFAGVKQSRRGVDNSIPPSVQVRDRVELYIYSQSGPSWPDLR